MQLFTATILNIIQWHEKCQVYKGIGAIFLIINPWSKTQVLLSPTAGTVDYAEITGGSLPRNLPCLKKASKPTVTSSLGTPWIQWLVDMGIWTPSTLTSIHHVTDRNPSICAKKLADASGTTALQFNFCNQSNFCIPYNWFPLITLNRISVPAYFPGNQ